MPSFVALLRGINVGRGNRIAMADLRALFERLGCTGVRTLLNSGNVIFTSSGRAGAAKHAAVIQSAVLQELGLKIPIVVKTAAEIEAACSENTLAEIAEPSKLLVAFTQDATPWASMRLIESLLQPSERFHRGTHAAYLACPEGIRDSKAAEALLTKAGTAVTTRNWATVLRIREALGESCKAIKL